MVFLAGPVGDLFGFFLAGEVVGPGAASPRGRVTNLTALRSNHSPYDNQPSGQVSYVSWAGVSIQVGNDPAATAVASTPIVKQVP
jgi:hypothetical protein